MEKSHPEIIEAWEAFISPVEKIPIDEAVGRVASSTIRQYPPGIPEIIPGMIYSKEIIKKLDSAFEAGSQIIGVNLESDRNVTVKIETTANAQSNIFITKTHLNTQITPAVADEIADFFNAGFSSAPYYHFAFHESDPLTALPPSLNFAEWGELVGRSQDFDLEKTRQLSIAQNHLKRFYPLNQLNQIELPNGFHRWTDNEICRQNIKMRLADDGYVTLVREKVSHTLVGLLHARAATIERLFETEEWRNPLLFSQHHDSELSDTPDRFFNKIFEHFALRPEDQVMTISAQLLHPTAMGGAVFYDMMRSVGLAINPAHARLPLLCEIPPDGTAHTLNTACASKLIFGVLNNDHPLIYSEKTSDALYPFIADKSHWNHALKSTLKEQADLKNRHYIPRVTDHKNVVVKPNGDLGLAVFATADIKLGMRIAIFEGETYTAEKALNLPSIMRDHAIQTGPKSYVFGYRGLAHCLCHSCDPNCGIRNHTEIFAVRDIKAGEQVTWDYRCSENSNWVLDKCLCGTLRCTGKVENYDSLSSAMKFDYLSRNMVSEWISARWERPSSENLNYPMFE